MRAPDEPVSRSSMAARRLLRGECGALAEAERLAASGDRVAALACGHWHQQHNDAQAFEHLRQAAEAGNPVAGGLVARSSAL